MRDNGQREVLPLLYSVTETLAVITVTHVPQSSFSCLKSVKTYTKEAERNGSGQTVFTGNVYYSA